MSRKIQLTKLNSGYCTDPEQDIIAAPVAAEVDLLTPTPVDVSQGALWRAPLSPTVTSVGSLVNCTAAVVPSSTNVSVTGSTTGAGSLEFTLDDGDSGTDSNTLTLNIVGSSGGSIAAYSGSDERGTQANPAVSPFGTMLLASVASTPADELFSELYGANWDFGDANAGLVDYGPRVGQSANTVHSTLITNHTYTVPDGQGLTEFTATATVKASTGEEYTATKSIWVVDQETHFGAANTVYVSNTLSPVDETTFTAAGALAGATYLSAPPAYNTYAGKRVQFYGGDVFSGDVLVGLGQHGGAISSWGTGNAELSDTLKLNAKSNGIQEAAGGGSFIKDADIIAAGGFTKNFSISNIRVATTSLGLATEGYTIDRVDSDYSNLTVPDSVRGSIVVASSYNGMYVPSNGLDPSNANYSAGLFISNSAIVGSSALSICTQSSGTSGNIFDFVGGTSVTSMDVDSTTYNPNDVVPLTAFGSMTIAANGDYVVTPTSYSHSINIQIDVLTDDGVKTFYTGQCRAGLNISGIYAQIQGVGLSNILCKNSREHNERMMGLGLFSALDTEDGAGFEQAQKHGRSLRCSDSQFRTPALGNVPVNTGAFGGGSIPFGNEGIDKWGGTARDASNFWYTKQDYFSQSHVKSIIQKSMTGKGSAASHFTANDGNSTDTTISGFKDILWHDLEVVTDDATSSSVLINNSNDNVSRAYVVKAQVSGDKTVFDPVSTNVYNREGVSEPYYIDAAGDLPTPLEEL